MSSQFKLEMMAKKKKVVNEAQITQELCRRIILNLNYQVFPVTVTKKLRRRKIEKTLNSVTFLRWVIPSLFFL